MPKPVLEVRELWVGEGPAAACRGVSLTVHSGEVVCVLGGERAGKSQLLRCIGLDFAPSSGKVLLNGTEVSGVSSDRRRELRARSIELVHPPAPEGTPDHTVPGARSGLFVSSSRRTTVPVAGMRQRIQIAKALTHRSDVLLLDEPLAGVDAPVRARVLELLDRLRSGGATAVVIATRDPDLARIADRVVVLHDGAVIESGLPDRVLEDPRDPRTRRLVEERRSA